MWAPSNTVDVLTAGSDPAESARNESGRTVAKVTSPLLDFCVDLAFDRVSI